MRFPWKLVILVAAVVLAGSGCTTIVRSSNPPNGAAPDGQSIASGRPNLSDNGRYTVFNSEATNLVAGDTNGVQDAFRRDNLTGTTIRVSVANDESQVASSSGATTISGKGDHVAFVTQASLEPADTNGTWDSYVRSISAGTTERVSIKPDGSPVLGGEPNHNLVWTDLSDDGRYALVTDTQPNEGHAYLRDLDANTTTLLAGLAADAFLAGDGEWIVENHLCSGGPCLNQASFVSTDATAREWISDGCGFIATDVTADARYVVGRRFGVYPTFESAGANGLVRWDRVTKQALKIPLEHEPDPGSYSPVRISNNGRFVTLVDGILTSRVIDLQTGVSQVLDTDYLGREVTENTNAMSISGSGRYVAFSSRGALTPEGTDGSFQVFTRYSVTPSITVLPTSTVARGAAQVTVQVRGKEFLQGATVEFPGGGITVHTVTLVNPGRIDVRLSVDPTATTGPAPVVVTNTGGFGSSRTRCADCLTIT